MQRFGGIETLRTQIALIGVGGPSMPRSAGGVPPAPRPPAVDIARVPRSPAVDVAPVPRSPAVDVARLEALESLVARLVTVRQQPSARGEVLVGAEVMSASVNIGSSQDLDVQVADLQDPLGRVVKFSVLTLTQIEVVAPGLVATDAVRLRIFLSGTRRDPQDLVAEFDGASHIAETWLAAFTKRRITYRDLSRKDTLWVQIRSAAGNTAVTTFTIRVWGCAVL